MVYFRPEGIENILDVICSPFKIEPINGTTRDNIKVNSFDGVQPLLSAFVTEQYKDSACFFTDVSPNIINGRISQSYLVESKNQPNTLALFKIQSISPRQARGKIKNILPTMILYSSGYMDLKLKTISSINTIWGLNPNIGEENLCYSANARYNFKNGVAIDFKKLAWKNLTSDNSRLNIPMVTCDANTSIQLGLGIQFASQYDWHVYLKEDNNIGITLPTTPEGSKEIFKLRDVPEGKKRRESLRNWISEHCRSNPSSEYDKVFVRKHMRGAMEFKWNGLYCKILPSQDALAELQKIKAM